MLVFINLGVVSSAPSRGRQRTGFKLKKTVKISFIISGFKLQQKLYVAQCKIIKVKKKKAYSEKQNEQKNKVIQKRPTDWLNTALKR